MTDAATGPTHVEPHHFPALETNPFEDRRLIWEAGKLVLDATPGGAWARAMGRFGYSGSRLYIGRFSTHREFRPKATLPYAVKIGPSEKIQSEFKKYKAIRPFYRSRAFLVEAPDSFDSAAIVLDFEGESDGRAVELRDLLFREARGEPKYGPEIPFVLKKLYDETLDVFHGQQTSTHAHPWSSYFSSTPADVDLAFSRAGELLDGGSHNLAECRKLFDDIGAETCSVLVGRIHGDLHPSNVILSGPEHSIRVAAIDWADYDPDGLLLRDFVLMECSLRFHRFPYDISLPHQQRFDARLAECWIDIDLPAELSTSRLRSCYESLAAAVSAVRSSAEKEYSKHGQKLLPLEYKKALFLQLVRQMRYYTYCHSAALGLSELGAHLRSVS